MQIGDQPYPFIHGSDDLVPILKSINYDYLDVQQTAGDVETYVFKTGGASGEIVQTIVVTYTDTNKAALAKQKIDAEKEYTKNIDALQTFIDE